MYKTWLFSTNARVFVTSPSAFSHRKYNLHNLDVIIFTTIVQPEVARLLQEHYWSQFCEERGLFGSDWLNFWYWQWGAHCSLRGQHQWWCLAQRHSHMGWNHINSLCCWCYCQGHSHDECHPSSCVSNTAFFGHATMCQNGAGIYQMHATLCV